MPVDQLATDGSASAGSAAVNSFDHLFDDVEPGKTYLVAAAAEDAEGHTSYAFGEFTTLTRNVSISIGDVILINGVSADSFYDAAVWANGDWIEGQNVGAMSRPFTAIRLL